MDEGKGENDEGREDLSCSFCEGPMEESQEHLEEECTGCDFERRNLKIHTMRGRQTFGRRMKAKIEEKKKKKKERDEGVAAAAGVGRVIEEIVWWNNWLLIN